MRGDAFFGDAVHLFGANLHFKLMAAFADDRGVKGLVAVGARNGNEVLDTAGDRTPEGMNKAENGIAGGYILGNNANGERGRRPGRK